jgi:hypothetical protein
MEWTSRLRSAERLAQRRPIFESIDTFAQPGDNPSSWCPVMPRSWTPHDSLPSPIEHLERGSHANQQHAKDSCKLVTYQHLGQSSSQKG